MDSSSLAQYITFLTVIAGFAYQAWREARQRRWDKEDRKELARKVATDNAQLASTVALSNSALTKSITSAASRAESAAQSAASQRDELFNAMGENTRITTETYAAADASRKRLEAALTTEI